MKLNENTIVTGNLVVLVPYERIHVPKYHEWMKSEELQLLTASEPLTIEEEYQMQKTWRSDSDIKECYEQSQDEVKSMVGDTNIFLSNLDDFLTGEIEIMIAEKEARGKGFGKEAVLLMLRYGIKYLNVKTYEAKIGVENNLSLALFSGLGFEKVNESYIFNECTLSRPVTDSWVRWLESKTSSYSESSRNL